MKNRFDYLTDAELYILSRQCVESSYEIMMSGKYTQSEQKIHGELMNEIFEARKIRNVNGFTPR